MAQSNRPRGRWWSRLHFVIRFLGLTGLVAAGIALVIAWRANALPSEPTIESWQDVQDAAGEAWYRTDTALEGVSGWQAQAVAGVLAGGILLFALALLIELLAGAVFVSGRRSAFGLNALVQLGLAGLLLVIVNLYAFGHYRRFDWTTDQQFTLPPELQHDLGQLQGKTTIVVYQRHKTFGQLADKPDAYDAAAERKVVEKVKDLVDQFREFGNQRRRPWWERVQRPRDLPALFFAELFGRGGDEGLQFRVETLDSEEENFQDRLAKLTEDAPELRAAVEKAPESTIFFHTPGKVQALPFRNFYLLDKTASQEQDNLVLLAQGREPFAKKLMNVEEKKPVVGIATIHEYLTTDGIEEYTLAGLKKALTARGFEVRDIVLKKWSRFAGPEPGVSTPEESKLDRLEERLLILDVVFRKQEQALATWQKQRQAWQKASLDELTKEFASQLRGRKFTEKHRQEILEQADAQVAELDAAIVQTRKRRDETLEEKGKLNLDALAEQRRVSDLRAKLTQALADCDLLIVPRMTIRNIHVEGDTIPYRLYKLDDGQVAAIKEFLKAGKPVLACFGPDNEPGGRMAPPDAAGPDPLEDLLGQLGIKFAKQTVLFDAEAETFAEQRLNPLATGSGSLVPPLDLDWRSGAGRPTGRPAPAYQTPNPLRESLRLAARTLGADPEGKRLPLDLRLNTPRPVYFDPGDGRLVAFDPEFLMTSPDSWNDDQPFPTEERTPQYEPPKPNDPARGTLDEKRRGPFPVGIAVETTLPASWYDSKATPATVRVVAVGHGGFFSGPELTPAKELMMADTCNWLLGRDEYLPKADQPWSYPRVHLAAQDHLLWQLGALVGLPALFLYLGVMVLLARRLR